MPLHGASADALCCSGSPRTVRELADHGIPVCDPVGLLPSKRTGWAASGP